MKIKMIYFSIIYKGDYWKIFWALKNREKIDETLFKQIENQINKKEIQVITILDDLYPQKLKEMNLPPYVLFYKGDLNVLKKLKFTLYATGELYSPKINQYLQQSIPEMMKNTTLISCYWPNLEEHIIDEYIKNEKPIIFISANGVDNPYFAKKVKENKNILIISQYPSDVNISKRKLKIRNSIAAALSENLLIYSSRPKSKIFHLVTEFLQLGKEIYCYPKILDDDGNSQLIAEGAKEINLIYDF